MVIDEMLCRNAQRYPNQTAIKCDEYAVTWRELDQRVTRIAAALVAASNENGERVAILMENNPAYIELYFAIARAGKISVPLNYKLTQRELQQIINQVEPSLIICEHHYADIAKKLVADEDCFVARSWVINKEIQLCTMEGQDLLTDDLTCPVYEANEQEVFSIFFTSGTTGLPKGAMVSHRNLIANAYNQLLAEPAQGTDVNFISTPLYHMGAVFMAVTYMLLGCTQIVARKFDPELWLDLAETEEVSVALLVPTMINVLVNFDKSGDRNLSKLRLIFYGGGPMHAAVLETALNKFSCGFMQGYGLTETLEATFLSVDDHLVGDDVEKQQRLESCGQEAVGAAVKIVDDSGVDLGTNERGEILIKSHSVIQGYWRQPDETAHAIKDGWFYTGDIGYLDDARYLYVVDRKKDIIVSGGVNIYSKEIENVIYELDAIREVAVIGLPDEKWGEAVTAVIVVEEGLVLEDAEILAHCTERLAKFKKPKSIHFLPELPKNPSGKILKRELRTMLASP